MIAVGSGAALLVVDIQNGFISEKNELPVASGRAVIPVINRILPRFSVRVASQDWHPADHGSFASVQPGRKPFDVGELGGLKQVFWPDHCVQGTRGADFHPDLDQRHIQAIFRKGTDPKIDSYSVFADNAHRKLTGLHGYLASHKVKEIFLAGLALDYCVRYTALDARVFMPDCRVVVILDACRPVDAVTGEEARQEMRGREIELITSGELSL